MTEVITKFVSRKISKIRWKSSTDDSFQQSDTFTTGSWDDKRNQVSVWTTNTDGYRTWMANQGLKTDIPENEPQLLCNAIHDGDIMDLAYLNAELIVTSSSTGSLHLFKHNTNPQAISCQQSWDRIHYHYGNNVCPCTCLATKGDNTIVTCGEDGRLNIIDINCKVPARIIEKADGCTQNAATFLKQNEVVTVNSIGQLKVWDIRQNKDEPTRIFLMTGERVPLHCVDKHPTQPHVVATGAMDGGLCIWDMRQDKFPVTLMDAHSSTMWEVRFHPTSPDNLFTCSEDGTVWHWDGTAVNNNKSQYGGSIFTSRNATSTEEPSTTASANPWLGSDASKHRVEITDVIPGNTMSINTIDITANTLLCGSDGEAIFTVHNMAIR
ncbi:nucleoporin Nup43-like [Tubulanus polymorphus]|uniref:nucleoporin Nup43-like n=1 Tax=Tubulanus polymorphus TaxID=672921 RepID=UPI003DA60C36